MNQASENSAKLFDDLCALFDVELARQENVEQLCRAQGVAAREQDPEGLEAHTQALSLLVADAVEAEKERIRMSEAVVSHLGLSSSEHTLTDLIARTPEPWKRRMLEFQTRIKAVLESTREAVRENAGYIRQCLKVVDGAVRMFTGQDDENAKSYDAGGKEAASTRGGPVLIDAQG